VRTPCRGELFKGRAGADADAARVRALAAYKDFLTLWKNAEPRHPHPERSQSRVREATVRALKGAGLEVLSDALGRILFSRESIPL